ncbi:MAG TPA: cell wall metabolism sensor histidine kinase WalK [Clostridiaceae bacterium]|nr:cell wall metabolism sensor histidine kinase WalK [Clostridiaceae bacterium]
MFKTIFSKLITIFIFILLMSFLVSGVMLYYFLGNFASSEKEKALSDSSEYIATFLRLMIESENNPLLRLFFENQLEVNSAATNSIIWVVDTEGRIIFDKPDISSMSYELRSRLLRESGYYKLPDERQYRGIMNGTGVLKEIGTFYGLFKDTGVSWLTIARPVRYKYGNGEERTIAAVYLHTPVPEIYEMRSILFKLFLISVLISIVVSIIPAYLFSAKISRPLKEICDASKKIASGKFEKKLYVKSRDEVGELAESFNNMASDLKKLEQMRRDFVANVSHELKTPMTNISGYIAGILDETIPPEKHKHYLSIVMEETYRLNRLVNDLLDLAKMESGEMRLNYQVFDINELIRRCVIKLENMLVKKDLEVEADFAQEETPVNADKDAIERVFINLLHNAVKFTPEGGKITIRTVLKKDRVIVSITDTGVGIEKEELSVIWDRFHKADKSRGKDKTGTGLGLAIVKNIINEHNQEVHVESELGKGSTFSFTLSRVEF